MDSFFKFAGEHPHPRGHPDDDRRRWSREGHPGYNPHGDD